MMGLFINTSVHPNLFKTINEIEEPNQAYFKLNYLSELFKEQKKVNDALTNIYRNLSIQYNQQKITQMDKWEAIETELSKLKDINLQHEEFKLQAMEWLAMLDRNNVELQAMLESEGLLKREIYDRINGISQSNQEVANQLEKYKAANDQLNERMGQLLELQKQVANQISSQADSQEQVINRLENQEALMEKALRQLTHFRSILFERSNYIVEKIENSYNLTSSYVYKLLTGTEQPLTLFMANRKKEEKHKGTD